MSLNDNAQEVAVKSFTEAVKEIRELQDWLNLMDAQLSVRIENLPWQPFSATWTDTMIDKTLSIFNKIAQGNGAILVRAKEQEKSSS
jgi:hypothetical protein